MGRAATCTPACAARGGRAPLALGAPKAKPSRVAAKRRRNTSRQAWNASSAAFSTNAVTASVSSVRSASTRRRKPRVRRLGVAQQSRLPTLHLARQHRRDVAGALAVRHRRDQVPDPERALQAGVERVRDRGIHAGRDVDRRARRLPHRVREVERCARRRAPVHGNPQAGSGVVRRPPLDRARRRRHPRARRRDERPRCLLRRYRALVGERAAGGLVAPRQRARAVRAVPGPGADVRPEQAARVKPRVLEARAHQPDDVRARSFAAVLGSGAAGNTNRGMRFVTSKPLAYSR